jgi:hypothetical protein
MISETYDIQEFLVAMVGKDWHEIVPMAERECGTAESRSYSVRGAPKARKMGSTKYAAQLKNFLYFMRYGSRPGSASDWEFNLYKPICKALVEKKQFVPAVLDVFR